MKPRRLELADVFRAHQSDFLARWGHVLSPQQKKALRDIRDCRSAALGGRLQECEQCGHRIFLFNSCRNRNCPKCQASVRAQWLADRETELLPVEYFHVVFTIPPQVASVALQNARTIYGILFRAVSETLLTIAADPKRLGAAVGFLAVLHTWGQNLHVHPHIHCVVPGGGLSPDQSRWISCRKSFFLPVKVLSRFFRKRFLIHLRRVFQQGKLQFRGHLESLSEPAAFEALCFQAGQTEWVVYAKPPFGGPDQVLKYLARYTHRVAISNRRLLAMADGRVTFEWKDYAAGRQSKTMTLEAVEFIRRFLLHVLPSGFVHIRHFGFLANRKRKEKLALCRALLSDRPMLTGAAADSPRTRNSIPDEQLSRRCPVCNRPLDSYPSPHRCGLCLFAYPADRRHIMTAMERSRSDPRHVTGPRKGDTISSSQQARFCTPERLSPVHRHHFPPTPRPTLTISGQQLSGLRRLPQQRVIAAAVQYP